jgi:hypothetical protein
VRARADGSVEDAGKDFAFRRARKDIAVRRAGKDIAFRRVMNHFAVRRVMNHFAFRRVEGVGILCLPGRRRSGYDSALHRQPEPALRHCAS